MDGIVFIARLGSTRLSRKHLIKASGQTFVEWMIKRFLYEFKSEIASHGVQLFLATSDEPVNRDFEAILKSLPVKIFYGSVSNIPLRLLQCVREHNLQNIISVDGDDILCSPKAARQALQSLQKTSKHKWIKTSGLALGMNVMGFNREVLEACADKIGTEKLETGWGRVFDSSKSIDIKLGNFSQRTDLRFTLDYQEDADFFKAVIEGYGDSILSATDTEIVNYVTENNLTRINAGVNDTYWENFNKQMKSEDK
jgi:spore coat polysaccharide biosynthesis protein SpsF (cytidylyltransferase family)